jgi:tetratricopeptide (TPR) repeat protein
LTDKRELITRTAFGGVLFAAAAVVFISPLNREFLLVSGGFVVLGLILGAAIWRWRRYPLHRNNYSFQSFLLDIGLFGQVIAATTNALTALSLPTPFLALHNTTGMAAVYIAAAAALAGLAAWMVLEWGDAGRTWAALLAAWLFSSTLYLRTFSVPEAGPVYGGIIALALLAAYSGNVGSIDSRFSLSRFRLSTWMTGFMVVFGLAIVLSPSLGQSLEYGLRFVVLVGLTVLLVGCIQTRKSWYVAAVAVVGIAGLLPILLAGLKLASLVQTFGLPAALAYRFHPTEMGGANLVARSVMLATPLGLALASAWRISLHRLEHPGKAGRFIKVVAGSAGGLFLLGSAFVVFYSRSWGAIIAWLVSLGIYFVFIYWKSMRTSRLWPRTLLTKAGFVGVLVVLGVVAGLGMLGIARQLNVFSFNGRFIHWYGAILALRDHPWVGGGPGYDSIYTLYSDAIRIFTGAQQIWDVPLTVIAENAGWSLRYHSHNLFLEIAAGNGIFGLLTFLGSLAALGLGGLRILRSQTGLARLGTAACLAGIAGELVWSLQDVLWVTPPFLSFPVWALVGLLLASPRLNDAANPVRANRAAHLPERSHRSRFRLFLVGLAVVVALLPAMAAAQYSAGYLAFQERRWDEAKLRLESAARYAPFNAQHQAMLGQVYLELRDIDRAILSFERANELKQGFSPHLSQLGWLAWLQGDKEKAESYFMNALSVDPGEIWQEGLYSSLGLVYSSDGRFDEAGLMFSQALRSNPRLASEPYWQKTYFIDDGGLQEFDILVAPDYLGGPSPELERRIFNHLGISDTSTRLFAAETQDLKTVSLDGILDQIEAGYNQADSYQAPLLMAAVAESARRVGLDKRAEAAYQEFQSVQPGSAFGFRDLGTLYREQGRLDEARVSLEQAVQVSPGNIASWYNLALVDLDRQEWDLAEEALDTITSQSLVTLFRSRLYDPDIYTARARLASGRGDIEQAAEELTKAIYIRQLPADYFALADIYHRQGKPDLAADQCARATGVLLRNWVRPLDAELVQAGSCLANGGEIPAAVYRYSKQYPLSGNMLLGHAYRATGQLDQALAAYQAASAARPDQGAPHFFLAETYQSLGKPDLAEQEYLLAAELDPHESMPRLALARMQWSMGDRVSALDLFRAAVEQTPGWDEAHIALANALFALNDLEAAAEHYHLAHKLDGTLRESDIFDFASHLAEADINTPAAEYLRGDYFTIQGQRHRVLFMHPDSSTGFTVTIPSESNIGLSFGLGIAPQAWDQPGDGVTFLIHIQSDAIDHTIFSKYIDPKNNIQDRRWYFETIDMSEYQGQAVKIILETQAGPDGDDRYDWAGWAAPKLIKP